MRIHFVRHGESRANLLREIANRGLRHGLTARGRAQAEALARRLARWPIRHVFVSPLLRAIETGVVLAHRLDVSYTVASALREYDCGLIEGRSDAEAWQRWQGLRDAWTLHGRWDERLEGGESFRDLRARFERFIAGLAQQYGETDDDLVCVSHGGLYELMLPLVLKDVDPALIARLGIGYTSHIQTEWRAGGLRCVAWDDQILGTPEGRAA